jgi:hypothetical protein
MPSRRHDCLRAASTCRTDDASTGQHQRYRCCTESVPTLRSLGCLSDVISWCGRAPSMLVRRRKRRGGSGMATGGSWNGRGFQSRLAHARARKARTWDPGASRRPSFGSCASPGADRIAWPSRRGSGMNRRPRREQTQNPWTPPEILPNSISAVRFPRGKTGSSSGS